MAINRLIGDKLSIVKFLILFFGLMAICITVSAWQSKALAADRFVATTGTDSPSSGSSGSPYATIDYAYGQASSGDTIKVKAGTYHVGTSSVSFLTTKNNITYVSIDGKYQAIVKPTSSSLVTPIWENQGDNVVIDGFQIDGTSTSSQNGLVNQGSYVTIKNNEVHHIKNSGCSSAGGAAINILDFNKTAFMTGTVVTANKVHDIGDGSCQYVQSIYISTRATVTNNVVYDNPGGAGIHLWHDAHDVTIVNNTIDNHNFGIVVGATNGYTSTDDPYGYKPCTMDSWGCTAKNIYVTNNIITGSDYGINNSGSVTNSTNTYNDNLMYDVGTAWSSFTPPAGSVNIIGTGASSLFTNYAANDFHLSSSSDAIDEGGSTNAPSVDLDGNARTGTPDIGAYEYGSSGGSGSLTLTFYEKDSVSATTGYWSKQALIDGVVVWEADPAADGTGWNSRSVTFTPSGSSINLQFRLITKNTISNFPVAYYVDDVAISGATVTSGSMESTTGWTYAETNGNFSTGALDNVIYHGGSNSYKMSYPGGIGLPGGNYSTVSQTVSVPASRTLTFWEKDSVSATTGYWSKQALIDGVVVWEVDAASDGTTWAPRSITFTPAGSSFTLQFRLITKGTISNFPVAYYIDDVAISGLTVTSGSMESTTGWTYAETNGNFSTGALDNVIYHGGSNSYKMSYPGGIGLPGGNYSTVSQSF